jgi:hypothetical protein
VSALKSSLPYHAAAICFILWRHFIKMFSIHFTAVFHALHTFTFRCVVLLKIGQEVMWSHNFWKDYLFIPVQAFFF